MALLINDMDIPETCVECFRSKDKYTVLNNIELPLENDEYKKIVYKVDCKNHIASISGRRKDCPMEEVDL